MIAIDQTFVDKIRVDCTNPPTDVLSDSQIIDRCNDVVREMNGRLTNKVLRSFLTVADQQEYSVDSVTIRVPELWREGTVAAMFGGASGNVSSIDLGGVTSYVVGQISSSNGLSMWEYPSLFLEWSRKLKAGRNIDPKSWVFSGKQILLMPPPGETGDYVVYMSVERFTANHLPADWEYCFRWGVLAECLPLVALMRWNEAGVNVGGGLTTYSPQKFLVDQAKEYRTKFETECDKLAMLHDDLRSAS